MSVVYASDDLHPNDGLGCGCSDGFSHWNYTGYGRGIADGYGRLSNDGYGCDLLLSDETGSGTSYGSGSTFGYTSVYQRMVGSML